MATMEDLELLKAALAVAVADGKVTRSEMGVIKGLALRVGVGQASLDAMMDSAQDDDSVADSLLIGSKEKARKAFELLVAQARIDGDISGEERDVLVRIAGSLKIAGEAFDQAYSAGLARADKIRKRRNT